MNDKTWFTKLCDLGLSFEEYTGLVVAIEVEHFKSKSGKFVPIEKSSGVPHKCSQNPNAYTNGQQQAQQQPKQPSRDPDDMLFWDGLTHTQMVAKVFEVYGEEWMKQREQQQLKLLHARIHGMQDAKQPNLQNKSYPFPKNVWLSARITSLSNHPGNIPPNSCRYTWEQRSIFLYILS